MSSSAQHSPIAAAIFVHGIFSGGETWDKLVGLLEQDPFITRSFLLSRFKYSSPKVLFNPLKRVPTLQDAAESLGLWLRENEALKSVRKVVLVGHSQGGLVIQRYLSTMLLENKVDQLRSVRAVVLLATPNTGSELLISLRKGLEVIWSHPQERELRALDDEVERARRVVLERAVLAPGPTNAKSPIRFFVYAGASDGIVTSSSAKWMFPNAAVLPGDHFSVHQPTDRNDLRFTAIRSALRWARHSFLPDGLLISTEALDIGNPTDVDSVNALATDLFEPNQAIRPKDLRHWLQNYNEDWQLQLAVLVVRVNGEIRGFTMFHESDEVILVDYIAVARDAALGNESPYLVNRMIEQLRSRATFLGGVPVVFEVEDPDTSSKPGRAKARIKLFKRYGALEIQGLEYAAPNMETMAPGDEVPHKLMYARPARSDRTLSKQSAHKLLSLIYKVWYRNWFSHYPDARKHDAYLKVLCDRALANLQDSYDLN